MGTDGQRDAEPAPNPLPLAGARRLGSTGQLVRLLDLLIANGTLFALAFGATAIAWADPRLGVASGLVAAFVVVALAARSRAHRSPELAALIVGWALVFVVVGGVIADPALYGAQTVALVLSVVMVLPWVRGRRLAAMAVGAIGGIAVVSAVGAQGAPTRWLVVANSVAAASILLAGIAWFTGGARALLDELTASELRFRALGYSTATVVFVADPAGRLLTAPVWRTALGAPPAAPGDPAFWGSVHPEDRDAARAAWDLALASSAAFEIELRLGRVSDWRWLRLRGAPVRGEDGAVQEWIGAGTDVTVSRRLEQEELEAARRKDEFIAMLGHELRNPLAPVLTALQLLERRGPLGRELQIVRRQADHLARIVDGVVDLSRMLRGRITVAPVPADLGQLIRDAAADMRPLFEQRHMALEVDAPEGIVVLADPTRMAQVAANILQNALRYGASPGRVHVAVGRESDRAFLRVRDDGVGIPALLLPHVFEPMVQGERGLDRRGGGLGIGLAIARRVVELHGGTILAESPGPGLGSAFTVWLPLLAGAPAASSEAAAEPSVEGRRVLVVDDNDDARATVAELLRDLGCSVDEAPDGPGALARAAAARPDVVLLDLGMPGMDGYEVARRLREAGSPPRIVALTGYGEPAARERALAAGFDDFLVKPAEAHALRLAVS